MQDLLRDGKRSRFVVVTRPAALPRLETARLMKALRRLGTPPAAVLVNAMTPMGCPRCNRAAAVERREVRALRRIGRGWAMLAAPRVAPPPRGADTLERFFGTWKRIE